MGDAARKFATSGTRSILIMTAEALHAHPKASLVKICNHVGAPFTDSLLHWKPNEIPVSWRDLDAFEGWLDIVVASCRWQPRPQDVLTYPTLKDDFQKECIDVNMPVYEELLRKRSNELEL